jgi:hypothetical protein
VLAARDCLPFRAADAALDFTMPLTEAARGRGDVRDLENFGRSSSLG